MLQPNLPGRRPAAHTFPTLGLPFSTPLWAYENATCSVKGGRGRGHTFMMHYRPPGVHASHGGGQHANVTLPQARASWRPRYVFRRAKFPHIRLLCTRLTRLFPCYFFRGAFIPSDLEYYTPPSFFFTSPNTCSR